MKKLRTAVSVVGIREWRPIMAGEILVPIINSRLLSIHARILNYEVIISRAHWTLGDNNYKFLCTIYGRVVHTALIVWNMKLYLQVLV